MAGREARLLQAESPAQWRRLAVRGLDVDGNVARDASDHVHQQLSAAGAAGEHLDSCGGERRPRLGEIYIFNIFFLLRFYVPAGFICYIVACLRCLWATAELQDSWLRGLSFQMGNFCFLPGTFAVRSDGDQMSGRINIQELQDKPKTCKEPLARSPEARSSYACP